MPQEGGGKIIPVFGEGRSPEHEESGTSADAGFVLAGKI